MTDPALLGAAAMLGSAAAHAVMALFTKRAGDILVFRSVSLTLSALWLSPVLFLFPFPDWEVWRFLLLSAGIIWAFNMLMISAFSRGDMNLVYPVMRGSAPIMTGVLALFVLGEGLSPPAIAGLVVAGAALIGFAWPERGAIPGRSALVFAFAAASMTALYSVTDASGVRAAGDPLVYVAWFFALQIVTIGSTALIRRGGCYLAIAKREAPTALVCSVFNIVTYGLALFAFSLAPVAPMAAMRESSIVFGAILAALVLKEPFGLRRTVLAIVLAVGLAILQLA